jgi:hypothetical protein
MEFAYAELLELSRNLGEHGIQFPFIVPIFVGTTVRHIERTPWLRYWERGLPVEMKSGTSKRAARELIRFYQQETKRRTATT